MEKIRKLLSLISSGKSIESSSAEAGYSSIEEARTAIKDLADLLPGRFSHAENQSGTGTDRASGGSRTIIINTDGASRGNPGPASAAAVAYSLSGELIGSSSEFIGKATNNEAEYRALILGIDLASDLEADTIIFRLDSELVVRQIMGEYKIKKPHLAELAETVRRKTQPFADISYENVPRSKNLEADRLANEVLDRLKKDGVIS
ncbi:MAG: ribonuclease HI family protein [Candidatus Krumholzibacteriota bacterium]|nr:ribonuclease HI family protein [Candidatus Krumholzibacteriota bacterium]